MKSRDISDSLPGFEVPAEEETSQNDSQSSKKKKKSSGGFQAMGFSFPVMKGITKRGYKQPTPIQRKVSLNTLKMQFSKYSVARHNLKTHLKKRTH